MTSHWAFEDLPARIPQPLERTLSHRTEILHQDSLPSYMGVVKGGTVSPRPATSANETSTLEIFPARSGANLTPFFTLGSG